MADKGSFAINRLTMRRMFLGMGISERNISTIISTMEKSHRHINAITLASMLEKMGADRDRIRNVFRRLGMSDVNIHRIMEQIDEQRIINEVGRVFNVELIEE